MCTPPCVNWSSGELELVGGTEADDSLIDFAHSRVANLEVNREIVCYIKFSTASNVGTKLGDTVEIVDTCISQCEAKDGVEVESFRYIKKVVYVGIEIPHIHMIFLEEIVERSFAAQVVGEEILEFGTKTEVLDFSTIIYIKSQAFLAFLGLCRGDSQHSDTDDYKNLFHTLDFFNYLSARSLGS